MQPICLYGAVFKFSEENDIKHPFNQQAKTTGKHWFRMFLKRHSEIYVIKHTQSMHIAYFLSRKAQFINPARAEKLNKFIVDDHFQRLNEVYDKLDLKTRPDKIYNMDEKDCRSNDLPPTDCIGTKGSKKSRFTVFRTRRKCYHRRLCERTWYQHTPMIIF